MDPDLENPADEIKRLQRCINDLISVLALPAIWSGGEPSQIVSTLLDALLGMLNLDLIYVRWNDSASETPIEMLRVARTLEATFPPQQIAEIVDQTLLDDDRPSVVRNSLGNRDISLVSFRLGLHGELGLVVAGSQRADFPQQTERLVLSVAVNHASIGLQEGQLLNEQRRLASELDQRVAQRTAELATTNKELTREIAERKKIEERFLQSEAALQKAFDEIKKSEARLRQVIDTIPTLAWCNLPDGPNEFLNKGWHEYTGLSPEESHGWRWQVAFHPEDLSPLLKQWQELLISGEPGEIEARLRRYDGVYRWFLIRVEPFRDEAGRILRWYGTSTDIDDRKRAEEQLKRSETFLTEGQRLSSVGTFSWRVATDEITWSEQLYRIFEFEQGTPVTLELIGTRVHPEDIPSLNDMISRARSAVSGFEYEHRLLMPNQSVKYVHLIAHVSSDKDGQLEYIGAAQDVTQRRLSEEALAKARSELTRVGRVTSLGVLTASIAHEVNQPLSGIITNASTCLRMLSADPPNVDGARETARRTIRDGNRASEVITQLRTLFSKKTPSSESVDLNEAAREVIALSLSELQARQVILRPELADDLPRVSGDRVQLQQVILNLIRNASDSMSTVNDRSRELLIRTERDEDDRVRLSVKDAGVGLEPQCLDRLFDVFYTTKNDGMGIGLSVSRSIIESHYGRLWAAPNDGPGATFSFSIPCAAEGVRGDVGMSDAA